MTYSRRSFSTRCIAGYPTGRVITVEVEEERLHRASSVATHIRTNPLHREVCIRLTAWHCLSFPLPHFLLSEGGYGRGRTSAKHKVDSYSTDWRKLICTYAPVAPTYKTYPTFFVTSPTRENSIGGATKWWGATAQHQLLPAVPTVLALFSSLPQMLPTQPKQPFTIESTLIFVSRRGGSNPL